MRVVFICYEEDLQVALHHRAVLQLLKLTDFIADIDVRTTDCWEIRENTVR